MKKIDFLLEYEVKPRELDNMCLVKYELERRGYKVALVNSWYAVTNRIPDYDAEVVVISACYKTSTLNYFTRLAKRWRKVVNMQWEQVTSKDNEKSGTGKLTLKGEAKKAVHVAWGSNDVKYLVEFSSVPQRNVILCGHIGLDFMRERFRGFYASRKELFSRYHINNSNKIGLFISSFSYIGLPESQLIISRANGVTDAEEYTSISEKSQERIISWILRALEQDKSLEFVYRPHPAEASNPKLLSVSEKNKRFHVITDESVKQWIIACDDIYMWNSTCVAEVKAAGKTCGILRPIELMDGRNLAIYDGVDYIVSFQEFCDNLYSNCRAFPINDKTMEKYYMDPSPRYSYEILCDELERIYKDETYTIHSNNPERYSMKNRVFGYFCGPKLGPLFVRLSQIRIFSTCRIINMISEEYINSEKYYERQRNSSDDYTREKQEKNSASTKEIRSIIRKINKCIHE